jgi:hypothetical protein
MCVVEYGTSVNVYEYTSGLNAGVNVTPGVMITMSSNRAPRRILIVYTVSTPPDEWVTVMTLSPRGNETVDATPETNEPEAPPNTHDAVPDANVTVRSVDATSGPTPDPSYKYVEPLRSVNVEFDNAIELRCVESNAAPRFTWIV